MGFYSDFMIKTNNVGNGMGIILGYPIHTWQSPGS